MPFQQPRECCIHAGIQIWTWNACAISFDDLDSLHARLSEQFSWDICLFQEGLKRTTAEHIRCEQYTLLKGSGEGRGAPMIHSQTAHCQNSYEMGSYPTLGRLSLGPFSSSFGFLPPLPTTPMQYRSLRNSA